MTPKRTIKEALLIIIILLTACCAINAQSKEGLPPFKIRLTSGVGFTFREIKADKPVVLIYFDTDCAHCRDFARSLTNHKDDLANKMIIWITYQNMEKTKFFDNLYKISSMPNCKIGSEGYSFVVQKFYDIQKFPYIILFNKTRKAIKTLSADAAPESLAKTVSSFH